PPQHRESHEAARNRGTYPANGAVRLRCYIGHALVAVESDPEWSEILGLPESARLYRDGDLWLAVESVGSRRQVRIGIGETLHEALADLQDTAIQGVGRDGGV